MKLHLLLAILVALVVVTSPFYAAGSVVFFVALMVAFTGLMASQQRA